MLLGRGSLVAGLGQRSGSPLRARGACRATAALRLPWQRPRPRQQAAAVPQLPAPLPVPTPTSEQDIAAEFWAAADKLRRDVTDDATRAQCVEGVGEWWEAWSLTQRPCQKTGRAQRSRVV